jgi:hypothetical protein
LDVVSALLGTSARLVLPLPPVLELAHPAMLPSRALLSARHASKAFIRLLRVPFFIDSDWLRFSIYSIFDSQLPFAAKFAPREPTHHHLLPLHVPSVLKVTPALLVLSSP